MYSRVTRSLLFLLMVFIAMPAFAQQTGTISGKVVDQSGASMPGVTVEARSTVLPGPRTSVTSSNGSYQLAALPPGDYTVAFTLSGMQAVNRKVQVLLSQDVAVNVTMSVQSVSESVTVTAAAGYIEKTSAAINSTLSNQIFDNLPVGTEYRDLVKLIPGVQYTQDAVRGPSAGGSGQDNVYNFDGVNVTLPLFGTLASEPASHDIAQISVVKGGARAVDFNRAGGFSMDSVSKSGTSRFSGEASYRYQAPQMRAKLVTCAAATSVSTACNNQGKMYTDVNFGGPGVKDKLFFYGSYYQPHVSRENVSNAYGSLPNYSSNRYEGFGKVTLTPVKGLLLNASYRGSKRVDKSNLFGSFASVSTGTGNETSQRILTGDGSWIINDKSFISFKMTRFANPNQSRPDNESSALVSTAIGTQLDINALDTMGAFNVPLANSTAANAAAINAFRQTYINRYGYDLNGVKNGGGLVGYGSTFDKDDFFRNAGQISYNLTVNTGDARHEFHVGYQRYTDAEDLTRNSNGWGSISVPGGQTSFNGTPIFFQAAFQQQTTGVIPKIRSEYKSQSIEFNDTITWKKLALNLGVLDSNDTLYGQGLNVAPGTLSGYIKATGNLTELRRYKMYEIPWSKMVQPRISATYAYDGENTVYASWAKYNPAASSLPRAASWDRNLATTINGYFDANGRLFGSDTIASSSGKLFVEDMTPRTTEEYLVGTARQFGSLSARVYWRYRHSTHFWEDTNNNARVAFRTAATPDSVPNALYIADLTARIAQIGSGSTYVIADLDGSFTKYKEVTTEAEWHGNVAGRQLFLRGSYTWSHYFGNVDQDGSTTAAANDGNIFIGSSNIGDSGGRQLWDFKLGDLHGDRRHMAKMYGTYMLPWSGSVGFYAVYQSGQPWEATNRLYYPTSIIGTSTSDTVRYAEPAGSRVTPEHYQLDLNYTQELKIDRIRVQLVGDIYNVANKQTGYNYQPSLNSAAFGVAQSYWAPRTFQLTAKIKF
ncbi:MAG: TonB-dependent receptor [Acidobacteria bacterium]|nr:TonB-dependent receptor [Acidobacteriota bacterium]